MKHQNEPKISTKYLPFSTKQYAAASANVIGNIVYLIGYNKNPSKISPYKKLK